MIQIFVNGKELVLYSDTTLNIEYNNALFASEQIEGDIVYSFELPVAGNETALDFAHLPMRKGCRVADCLLILEGIISIHGRMLFQKADKNTITAAVSITPYPDGFGSRHYPDNKDSEIVISNGRETHSVEWKQFLNNSLENEDVKFAPFINENGYGSENEDFGVWKGVRKGNIVNPFFFDENGVMIDSDERPFSKIRCSHFWLLDDNDDSYMERNQIAFCPQIRLSRLLDIWCANAGFRFVNHLGADFNKTFVQTTRSLDGTSAQFIEDGNQLTIHTTASAPQTGSSNGEPMAYYYCNSFYWNGISQDEYVHNGMVYIPSTGWWTFEIKASLVLPDSFVEPWGEKWAKWLMLAAGFLTGGGAFPVGGADLTALIITLMGSNSFDFVNEQVHIAIYKGTHTIKELDEETTSDLLLKRSFSASVSPSLDFCSDIRIASEFTNVGLKFVFYVKKEQGTGNNKKIRYFAITNAALKIKILQRGMERMQGGLNIFRKSFSIPELCPDITNSGFLKTVKDTFGMCYFASFETGEVEFVPFVHIRNAGSLDLTTFELEDETEMTQDWPSSREFRLKPLTDESHDESLRLPDTENDLPEVLDNIDHCILSLKTNTMFQAKSVESEDSWSAQWVELSGNPDSLIIGNPNRKKEKLEPSAAFPHQREMDGTRSDSIREQMMVANFTIGSDMFNSEERGSELIFTQYRGYAQFDYSGKDIVRTTDIDSDHHRIIIERVPYNYTAGRDLMLPVWGDDFALKAKGGNSLGEVYVKPLLQLLDHGIATYRFRVPMLKIKEIMTLIQPQQTHPANQTRFIVVHNIKSVPKKIRFQIDHNDTSGTVLCEIESVRLH